MSREDIIRMAREVGLADAKGVVHAFYQLESFAALVASAEREACAKVADNFAMTSQYKTQRSLAEWCASSIRAREQA